MTSREVRKAFWFCFSDPESYCLLVASNIINTDRTLLNIELAVSSEHTTYECQPNVEGEEYRFHWEWRNEILNRFVSNATESIEKRLNASRSTQYWRLEWIWMDADGWRWWGRAMGGWSKIIFNENMILQKIVRKQQIEYGWYVCEGSRFLSKYRRQFTEPVKWPKTQINNGKYWGE